MNIKNDSRLFTLDAMRGFAAIIVVFYHFNFIASFAPSGYLAVDFFFLMSGIVIAKAYAVRLSNGLDLKIFLIERLIRLFPLYLIGVIIGVARRAGQIAVNHPEQITWTELSISLALNIFFLPSPATYELAPINVPSWSLFFELFVNIVWASLLSRRSKNFLFFYVSILGVALAVSISSAGSADQGSTWAGFHGGALRSFFGFGLGILMARYLENKKVYTSIISLFACLSLCIILFLDVPKSYRAVYDCLSIFIFFPLIALLGAVFNPPAIFNKSAETLGDISYPMYVIHFVPMFVVSYVARKFNVAPLFWIPTFMVVLFFTSLFFARQYDPQVRKLLKQLILKKNK